MLRCGPCHFFPPLSERLRFTRAPCSSRDSPDWPWISGMLLSLLFPKPGRCFLPRAQPETRRQRRSKKPRAARSIAFSSFGVRETAILLDVLIKLAPDDAERDLTLTLGIPASAAPVRLPSGGLLPVRDALFRVNGFSDDRCASVSIHSEALSVIQDPAERAAAAFMTAARAIGEIRAMRCLTAFPAITSDEEEGRFLSAQAFAAALRTRFSEKDWEKLSDPDQLLESETRYRVPDSASNEPLFSGLEEGATRLPGFSRAFIQGSAGDTPFLAAGAVCGAFLISGEVTGNEKTCRKLLRDLGNETAFFVPLGFLYGRGSVRFSRFRHRTSASSRSEPSQLPVEIYRQL